MFLHMIGGGGRAFNPGLLAAHSGARGDCDICFAANVRSRDAQARRDDSKPVDERSTCGRKLISTRYIEPEAYQQLLLSKLG